LSRLLGSLKIKSLNSLTLSLEKRGKAKYIEPVQVEQSSFWRLPF